MVRVQVKPQEDFRVSSVVSDLSGRTIRVRVPKPSSREDPKAQESLQCHLGQAEGFQSRSGRADRVSYVFVFGHPPRADVDDPVYRMEDEHTSVIARHAKTSVASSLRDLLKPFCEGNFLEQKVSF